MTRPAGWTSLTSKEKDVLMLLAEGKTNAAIARPSGISSRTVQKHLERIFVKLGARSRTEVVAMVYRKRFEPDAGNTTP